MQCVSLIVALSTPPGIGCPGKCRFSMPCLERQYKRDPILSYDLSRIQGR
jgi:hypothetical protein